MAKNHSFSENNDFPKTVATASTTSNTTEVARHTSIGKNATAKYIPPFRRRGGRAPKQFTDSKRRQHRYGNNVRQVHETRRGGRAPQQFNFSKRRQHRYDNNVRQVQETPRRGSHPAVNQTVDIEDRLIGRFIGFNGQNIEELQRVINYDLSAGAGAGAGARDAKRRVAVRLSVCNGEGPQSSVVQMIFRGCTHSQVETARHFVENALDCQRVQNKERELLGTGQRPPAEHRVKLLHAREADVVQSMPKNSREQPCAKAALSTTVPPAGEPPPASAAADDPFFSLVARNVYPSRNGWQDVVQTAVETALSSRFLVTQSGRDLDFWTVSCRDPDNIRSSGLRIEPTWHSYAAQMLAIVNIFQRDVVVHADSERQGILLQLRHDSFLGRECGDLCPGSQRNSAYEEDGEQRCGPIRLLWGGAGWRPRLPSPLLRRLCKV